MRPPAYRMIDPKTIRNQIIGVHQNRARTEFAPSPKGPQQEWRKVGTERNNQLNRARYVRDNYSELTALIKNLSKTNPAKALYLIDLLNIPIDNKSLRQIQNQNQQNQRQPLDLNNSDALNFGIQNGVVGALTIEQMNAVENIVQEQNQLEQQEQQQEIQQDETTHEVSQQKEENLEKASEQTDLSTKAEPTGRAQAMEPRPESGSGIEKEAISEGGRMTVHAFVKGLEATAATTGAAESFSPSFKP